MRLFLYLLITLPLGLTATELPGSKQSGPTCAFHANIPALTHLTGININDASPTSESFIKSIYYLKNRDIHMSRAFSRSTFFTIFGITTTKHKSLHPTPSDLTKTATIALRTEFDPHLVDGHFISLRTTGRLGQLHNILLTSKNKNTYTYHDPTTGKFHSTKNFATRILTPTKETKNRTRPDYQTSFHVIHNNAPPLTTIKNISTLPPNASIKLTEKILTQIPHIKKTDHNPIAKNITPSHATGIINLAKLAINAYPRHQKIPIVFINNQPHAITAYQGPFHPTTPDQLITIHNGTTKKNITTKKLLTILHSTNYQLTYLLPITPPTSASTPPPSPSPPTPPPYAP